MQTILYNYIFIIIWYIGNYTFTLISLAFIIPNQYKTAMKQF